MDQQLPFLGSIITYAQLYAWILYFGLRVAQGVLWQHSRKMSGSFWLLSVGKFILLQSFALWPNGWIACWILIMFGSGFAPFNFYESFAMNGRLVFTILGIPIPKRTWFQTFVLGANDFALYLLCMYVLRWFLEIFF